MTAINRRRIATFLGLTVAIDWGLVGLLLLAGVKFEGMAVSIIGMAYMLVPALVVILLARRWGVGLRTYGMRVPRRWELVLAPLLPMVITVLTVIAAVLLGFGDFDPSGMAYIDRLRAQGAGELANVVAEQMGRLPINVVLLAFLAAPIAGFTINGLFAFGEELGWRGFLQRELAPLGFARASALIGAIWGLWHAPLILLGHNFPDNPRLGVLVMTAACVLLGILISWVTLRAQTVFAAAVAHGTLNALGGVSLIALRGGTNIAILPLGYAGMVAMVPLVIAALLWPPRAASCEHENTGGFPPTLQEYPPAAGNPPPSQAVSLHHGSIYRRHSERRPHWRL